MATTSRPRALVLALLAFAGCRAIVGFDDRAYTECEPTESKCEGDAIVTCENDRWSQPVGCEEDTVCVDGACVLSCALGEKKCLDGGVVTCEDDGWSQPMACQDDTTCSEGSCVETCEVGERRCQDGVPEECVGGLWEGQSPCVSPLSACEAGECKQALMPLARSGGAGHTCVVGSAGGVYCWGINDKGQLGLEGVQTQPTPIRVPGLPNDVVEVGLAQSHTCARTAGGDVWCWGSNQYGQLGNSGASPQLPQKIVGIPPASQVRASLYATCVLGLDEDVWCFGRNEVGQVATPADNTHHLPALVPELAGTLDLEMGTVLTCGVRADGTAACIGDLLPPQELPLDDIVELHMNDLHQCAIREDGPLAFVACWGVDTFGGIGNGLPLEPEPSPVTLPIVDVEDVATGWRHTCVLADGGVYCAGLAEHGQLGDGNIVDLNAELVKAALPAPAFEISSSWGSACARLGPRELYCWGENTFGAVGDGSGQHQFTPVKIDWDAPDAE